MASDDPHARAGGVFVADTSVWQRRRHLAVADVLTHGIARDEILTCSIVELERMFAARNATELVEVEEEFSVLRDAPITRSVMRAAKTALRDLAIMGSAGYHRVKPPDAIIAAAAAEVGVGVLHYDRDYDRLAEVLSFESRWVVPAGSIT